ncbi:tripartite tricarboxylate transporter substrate binding protein [Pseudomonas matsuisoli]|uniref:ABC transporter substrate-binding protein n=1 Tax=Pseudomonas matsuisoli TaxID=1515666 RepID=A0A917PIJ0_9PSED|nr:tripartite tricarboxylate transporter substrate binding protein [Pseudomonas matsuisoli]GGJ80460.1 ABC transporter substrate-binding protein [Pseudomonas matsuisoli]
MHLSPLRTLMKALMLTTAIAAPVAAQAVDYPSKPVQVVLPIAPGGDTDVNARLFNKYLEKELGQSLAVVNVDGGGGTIGMRRVMSAKPDGYTALFFHGEGMVPKLAGLVDFGLDAFQMVAVALVDNTTVLVTHKDAPYKTMKEMVEYAKANPGDVEFGMLTGGYPHLVGAALEQQLGAEFTLVDVGGNAAKIVALRGHKIGLANLQYGISKDYFTSGDFINLGLLSPERNPLIPDVPTTAEQGYPLELNKFFYFAMPKGTPADVVQTFSAAVKKVVENPEYQAEASKFYLTPTYMGPDEATQYANKQYQALEQYKALFTAN